MTENEEIAVSVLVNGIVIAGAICFLALIVAITEPRPVVNKVGLDSHDLSLVVGWCIPYNATFEQELACYQAVYGGGP